MKRVALGLVAVAGLVLVLMIAGAALVFNLGVAGLLDERAFHNGLIQVLGQAQNAVMWLIGPPG